MNQDQLESRLARIEEKLDVALAALASVEQPLTAPKTPTSYTVEKVATALDCSVDVIYDEIHARKLKAFRVGRAFRVTATELDRYMARK